MHDWRSHIARGSSPGTPAPSPAPHPPAHARAHTCPCCATPREQCKTRLETHFKNVEAVMGYYNTCCIDVDGNRSMDAVFASVCNAIEEAK